MLALQISAEDFKVTRGTVTLNCGVGNPIITKAYLGDVPKGIVIDGLFSDWDEVKNHIIKFENQEISFRFSAGFTCMIKSCTKEDLIHASDTALYYAKKHGKDQIIYYNDISEEVDKI